MIILAKLIYYVFSIYELGLLLYILCSWIAHPLVYAPRQALARWYEPLLDPIRRWIPAPRLGGASIDFSPLLLLIVLAMVQRFVVALLVPPF